MADFKSDNDVQAGNIDIMHNEQTVQSHRTPKVYQIGNKRGSKSSSIVYDYKFTIGNSTQNYGFWFGVIGDIDPATYEGDRIDLLRVSTADDNVLFALNSGQIAGVSVIQIQFELFKADIVTFTWSVNAYKSLNVPLSTFFQNNVGNEIGVNISHIEP